MKQLIQVNCHGDDVGSGVSCTTGAGSGLLFPKIRNLESEQGEGNLSLLVVKEDLDVVSSSPVVFSVEDERVRRGVDTLSSSEDLQMFTVFWPWE